jgi:hypothetical protein
MIVSGRATMTGRLSPRAREQLFLRYRIAAAASELYAAAGFTVVYQDIILGAALTEVVRLHQRHRLHVVVLCPSPDAVAAREEARGKKGYRGITIADLDEALRAETPCLGLWLDSSAQTAGETAETILGRLREAEVSWPGTP